MQKSRSAPNTVDMSYRLFVCCPAKVVVVLKDSSLVDTPREGASMGFPAPATGWCQVASKTQRKVDGDHRPNFLSGVALAGH
jgi:hypothetical protein